MNVIITVFIYFTLTTQRCMQKEKYFPYNLKEYG